MADATEEKDLVDLEALARTATKAEPAAAEFGLDVLCSHLEAGREPFDDDDEGLPV